ncbi:urea transporter [Mucilaginibacter glaciei]|uniref:Urea transporter n=1 Tax=Mucilaginibacter glaciei TaxID=2772109 RepID=A0A926NN67_9SPHI|nr:urea transporter [Mucilaginibacter glaciei]MBD1391550.1 urea transporter [Mucilaginibacter glaciei]
MSNNYTYYLKAIVNSYAIVFFSQNRVLGLLLILVSFFNPAAGASGLFCVLVSLAYVGFAKYDRQDVEKGFFCFNSLLFGIGFGTFYHVNPAFLIWLVVGCLLCTFVTINLWALLGKFKLPFLSLPFIITFWVMLSAANSIFQMGLHQNSSAILNELNDANNMHNTGLFGLSGYVHFYYYPDLFFKALSAVFFQNSAIAGLLIAIGILVWSRIAMSVLILCFTAVLVFNQLTGIYPEGISHYHLGSNFMITAMAIGSFFLVPSWRSYVWSVVAVLFTFLFVNAFTRLIGVFDLPVLSLPFCVISILLLVLFRSQKGKTKLVVLQHYSPEKNLYQSLNCDERLCNFKYFDIKLPFMGSWLVSQGYNGDITHKHEWGQALDFVIADEDNKTYLLPGTLPENFYCYNKPVLACGDGVVVELVDHIEDNEIGAINIKENWGNTIVIKHTDGLYSKVSHLKKGSTKVSIGHHVKQGDIIALCGNSGRSPEPHLHFQLQATPYIGSKTIAYPFSYYTAQDGGRVSLKNYDTPAEGSLIKPVAINPMLKNAFDFRPGYVVNVATESGAAETFEVYTDSFKQSYLYSKQTGAIAYFVNDGTTFYFTGFYGDETSLLYAFYLAAYKVVFTDNGSANDTYPLPGNGFNLAGWLQDLIAPFYRYIKLSYQSNNTADGSKIKITGIQRKNLPNSGKQLMEAVITIDAQGICGFMVNNNKSTTSAQWTTGNIY